MPNTSTAAPRFLAHPYFYFLFFCFAQFAFPFFFAKYIFNVAPMLISTAAPPFLTHFFVVWPVHAQIFSVHLLITRPMMPNPGASQFFWGAFSVECLGHFRFALLFTRRRYLFIFVVVVVVVAVFCPTAPRHLPSVAICMCRSKKKKKG